MDLSYVERYLRQGVCLIPIAFKSKKPTVEWKQYQKRKPTESEISSWFNGKEANIAIVCGAVSDNLVVLDCDSQELFVALNDTWFTKYGKKIDTMTPVVQTGGGGYHVYLKVKYKPQLFHPTGEDRKRIPDIQSEGGYVLAPPSVHPSGNPYRLLNPDVKDIFHVTSLLDLGIKVPASKEQLKENEPGWVTIALKGVGQGERDNTCTKLAGYFRNIVPQDVATTLLLDFAEKCTPPMDEKTVLKCVNSVYKSYKPAAREEPPPEEMDEIPPYVYSNTLVYRNNISKATLNEGKSDKNATDKATERATSLAGRIREWVEGTVAWWSTDELDKDLRIVSPPDRKNRSKTLERLLEQGMLERHQKLNKQWRYINKKVTRLDYKHAFPGGELAISWPMGIEKYVKIYPGNLVVVAGTTNCGKTAFNIDFIYRNQEKYHIVYICSEMGDVELRSRLELVPNMTIESWKFEAVTRSSDFADVIVPDVINVIDYLEMAEDLYMVNSHLTKICERIGSGLAIVSIQKKEGQKWGRGQEFSAEKSKLYLSMDQGILRITKGKSWVNPKVNPNGLQVGFKIISGCQFEISKNWDWKR